MIYQNLSRSKKLSGTLESKNQSTIGCTPFEKHFNRTANTSLKNLISFNNRLDKGKSILSNQRARNWELHDGGEDGYLDADMDTQSDNLLLAQTIPSFPAPEVYNLSNGPRATKRLVSGGKYFGRATNRKNGEPYFNPIKKDIIDSSEHSITLDNGHNLRKSDLAFKGKLLPGPKKNCCEPVTYRAQYNFTFEFSRKEEAISTKEDYGDRPLSAKT